MPLPKWYRFIRTLPGVVTGLVVMPLGIYLVVAPTTYRNPSDPKLVKYADQMHIFVQIFGGVMLLIGLFLLYFGVSRYNKLPEFLRKYSFEELRLGHDIVKEVGRLTQNKNFTDFELDGGITLEVSYLSRKDRWRNRSFYFLLFGFRGPDVHIQRCKPAVVVEGVTYEPVEWIAVDSRNGTAFRHEEVREYTPDGERVKSRGTDGSFWDFIHQMNLDRPSVEDLRVWLDQIRSV